MTGFLPCAYAEQLQSEASKHLAASEWLATKFSDGRVTSFQKPKNIKVCRVHGEALSAETGRFNGALPVLREIFSRYSLIDTWKTDQFGLFYRNYPGWTLCKSNKRNRSISVLAYCNFTGSLRFLLMFVGKLVCPRLFGRNYGHELCLH